jgi:hypothetical protein
MATFPELFAVLEKQTDELRLGPVGFGAVMNDAARAYCTLDWLEAEEIAQHRDRLEATLRDGPGAARVYAALLLRRIDVAGSDAHLDRLLDSSDRCSFAPGGCLVFSGTVGSAAAQLHAMLETPRARALWEAVRQFRQATHYAEPARDAMNAWGVRFAELLERNDLSIARDVIESIAGEAPPLGIFGAVLLSRIDPIQAERRLGDLSRSSLQVPVIASPLEKAGVRAVADIARQWLVTLGFDESAS